jgi:AcrR family transcriptional regulator
MTAVMYDAPVTSRVAASKRRRRTQAERRAATRAALLDAAIDCLAEQGYAGTTTRRIAWRAGVTRGAVEHHFASKAELLSATTRHIRTKAAEQLLAEQSANVPSIERRSEQLLDRMWELYTGPLFQAALELLVAARTDCELRDRRIAAQDDIARLIELGAPIVYPELAGRPGLTELITTGEAAVSGLALRSLGGDRHAAKAWPATRTHLVTMMAELARDHTAAR